MIRVGVAGWDYPDWRGVVYPSPLPRGFDRLAYVARFVDVIEINVTFYRPIEPAVSRSWVRRAPTDRSFMFTAKLHRVFTHERAIDLRPEARVYRAGIDPLLQSGLLGAVLVQCPQSFHDTPASRDHLSEVFDLLSGLPLVAEFRHRSWDNNDALTFLRDRRVGFCNIDQPALGATLGATEHVTSRIGYVRLHGRNAAYWFSREDAQGEGPGRGAAGSARYDYLYSTQELSPWVGRIERMGGSAEEVFVIANNHYRGKGPANALMLKSALAKRRVPAPAALIATYPGLEKSAEADPGNAGRGGRQGRLF
jgi:uncharacterized protein YecE (DUF72 family)